MGREGRNGTDFQNIFNISPMDNVSVLALITLKSSGAWCDESFFVNGCTQVSRPFGGSMLLSQWWHFEFLRKGKGSEKGEQSKKG